MTPSKEAMAAATEIGFDSYACDVAKIIDRHFAKLRAIVDKLPKTADGIPILPDSTIYCPDGHPLHVAKMQKHSQCNHNDCYDDTPGDRHGYRYPLDSCYSTREAAEAAAKERIHERD